ncbi:hypothetical protein GEW28_21950, partial [Salmonella enterica]|nr:hypothetical protein [Salmonella enterica]
PVAGLKAGVIKSNTDIATIAVSSVAAKQFAIAADFKAKDVMNGDTWTLYGKNTGKGIKVYFYGETTSPKGDVNYNGHQWIIYDINDKLGVKLAGDQNVPADVFPMTVNIAAYQA